ncbi:WD repeat-containing protein 87 [Kappamyces sp. JEL0829]|nr:WD repeat-containing protein 87 [Kappamyces sp. JEL0829]
MSGIRDYFGTLDSNFATIWGDGAEDVVKAPILRPKGSDKAFRGIEGLCRWIYVPRWKVIIAATELLELLILSLDLTVLSSLSIPKPIMCMEFVDGENPELIAGAISLIVVVQFKEAQKKMRSGSMIEFDRPRYIREGLTETDWISHLAVDRKRKLIFASHDSNVSIYDYSGKRMQLLDGLHSRSISALCVWEEQDYLVTGSNDSTIKIWNSTKNLLYELKDHYQEITGLCMVGLGSDGKSKFLLSCSKDANVRMWSLEDGLCLNRINTLSEVNGIKWMRHGKFCTISNNKISVWELSRFFSTFFTIAAPLSKLKRIQLEQGPARILALGSTGSIALVSPRTGEKLVVGDPFVAETGVKDGVYDPFQGRTCPLTRGIIYALVETGDIAVYDAAFSPCTTIGRWKSNNYLDRVTCFAGLPIQPKKMQPMQYGHSKLHYFMLLCGTNSGQIVMVDPYDQGRQTFVLQAHASNILALQINKEGTFLSTAGNDAFVKIWRISYAEVEKIKALKMAKSLSGRDVTIRLDLVAMIPTTTSPDYVSMDSQADFVASVSKSKTVGMYNRRGEDYAMLAGHPSDDDHTGTLTAISFNETLSFLATSSVDGTVKIWDTKNNLLVRELQFNEPLDAVEFANARGDLLVSLAAQVVLVRFQDYLPDHHLEKIISMDWADDPLETPDFFDADSDFWLKNKNNIKVSRRPLYLSAQYGQLLSQMVQPKRHRESEKTSALESIIRQWPGDTKFKNIWTNETSGDSQTLKNPAIRRASQMPAAIAALQEQKSRIFDEVDAAPALYNVPEMNLDSLMKSPLPSIPTTLPEQDESDTDESGERFKFRNAMFEVIDNRKKEKVVKMKLEAQKVEAQKSKNRADIARPNAIGQQALAITRNGTAGEHAKANSKGAVQATGRRHKTKPKEFEDELEMFQSQEFLVDVAVPDMGMPIILDPVVHAVPEAKEIPAASDSSTKITNIQPDPAVPDEPAATTAKPARIRESPTVAAVPSELRKGPTDRRTAKAKEHVLAAETFGTMVEIELLQVEYVRRPPCPELYAKTESSLSFSECILDYHFGFVAKTSNASAANDDNPKDPPPTESSPPNRPFQRERPKRTVQTTQEVPGSFAPSDPDPISEAAAKLTLDDKSKLAWCIFKAAILKANGFGGKTVKLDTQIQQELTKEIEKTHKTKEKKKNVARVMMMKEALKSKAQETFIVNDKAGTLRVLATTLQTNSIAASEIPASDKRKYKTSKLVSDPRKIASHVGLEPVSPAQNADVSKRQLVSSLQQLHTATSPGDAAKSAQPSKHKTSSRATDGAGPPSLPLKTQDVSAKIPAAATESLVLEGPGTLNRNHAALEHTRSIPAIPQPGAVDSKAPALETPTAMGRSYAALQPIRSIPSAPTAAYSQEKAALGHPKAAVSGPMLQTNSRTASSHAVQPPVPEDAAVHHVVKLQDTDSAPAPGDVHIDIRYPPPKTLRSPKKNESIMMMHHNSEMTINNLLQSSWFPNLEVAWHTGCLW